MSVPSTFWSEKSTIVVVPPASAAALPVSQSSAVIVPPNGMSRCVWPSMKPGITRAPETSTTSAPSRGRSSPTAAIVSPSTATSARNEPSAVTTVPPANTFTIGTPCFACSANTAPTTSTMWSASASVSDSGGASATTLSRPAAVSTLRPRSSPRAWAALRIPPVTAPAAGARVAWSATSSIPISSPRPRMSPTSGCSPSASRSRARRSAPTVAERSSRPSSSMIAIVSSATAQPPGWPPNVLMWRSRPASAGSAGKAAKISSLTTVAASGKYAPVMPLAIVTRSGRTPARSWPNHVPVRPNPQITSSQISSTPWRSHSALTAGR